MIRTERLFLRKPTAADVEAPPSFLTDPRVMQFLGGVEDDPSGVVQNWLPDAQPELTWGLAHEHWGKGYATEAATAVREWFGRASLISLIAPRNVRSQGVAERLGATPGKTVELADGGPHVVWTHP